MAKGDLREFVRKHIGLTNAQIVEAAQREGVPLDMRKVASHRWHITQGKSASKPTKPRKARKATKRKPPKSRKAEPAEHPKTAALRKLIFELGFDAAQKVFEEFDAMHRGMR